MNQISYGNPYFPPWVVRQACLDVPGARNRSRWRGSWFSCSVKERYASDA